MKWLMVFLVLLAACTTATTEVMQKDDAMMEKDDSMMEEKGDAMENNSMIKDDVMVGSDAMIKEEDSMMEGAMYENTLAGSTTKYVEFSQEAYEKALSEDKVILLYFYASWCPTCKAEQPEIFEAFEEMNFENVVGFRVNYKDSDTDKMEEALAKEFGIAYQHTKVILVDGTQVLKAPDSWKKERYLEEIGKVA